MGHFLKLHTRAYYPIGHMCVKFQRNRQRPQHPTTNPPTPPTRTGPPKFHKVFSTSQISLLRDYVVQETFNTPCRKCVDVTMRIQGTAGLTKWEASLLLTTTSHLSLSRCTPQPFTFTCRSFESPKTVYKHSAAYPQHHTPCHRSNLTRHKSSEQWHERSRRRQAKSNSEKF